MRCCLEVMPVCYSACVITGTITENKLYENVQVSHATDILPDFAFVECELPIE
jgi:hypothetical protein